MLYWIYEIWSDAYAAGADWAHNLRVLNLLQYLTVRAGLACLMQAAREGLLDKLVSEKHRDLLLNTRSELLTSIEKDDSSVILAMFRIGRGPQVVRALRRPLTSIFSL